MKPRCSVPPISEISLVIRVFGHERLSIAFGPPVAPCRTPNGLTWIQSRDEEANMGERGNRRSFLQKAAIGGGGLLIFTAGGLAWHAWDRGSLGKICGGDGLRAFGRIGETIASKARLAWSPPQFSRATHTTLSPGCFASMSGGDQARRAFEAIVSPILPRLEGRPSSDATVPRQSARPVKINNPPPPIAASEENCADCPALLPHL